MLPDGFRKYPSVARAVFPEAFSLLFLFHQHYIDFHPLHSPSQIFHLGLGHLSFFYHCEKRSPLVESLQGRQKDLDTYPTELDSLPTLGIRS